MIKAQSAWLYNHTKAELKKPLTITLLLILPCIYLPQIVTVKSKIIIDFNKNSTLTKETIDLSIFICNTILYLYL